MPSYFFLQNPFFWLFSALVLGAIVGSFLNVVIHRLPLMLYAEWQNQTQEQSTTCHFNLIWPRSQCPNCKKTIPIFCNIPILSYLLLSGQCKYCASPIKKRYLAIEIGTSLITAYILWHFMDNWQLGLAVIAFSWFLIALTAIDLEHLLLPDQLTLTLMWLGLLINSTNLITDLHSAIWGAVLGYVSLWSVYWGFKWLTGKEGMGYGDFKLLAALGAWLGWQYLPLIILMASIAGTLICGFLILQGRQSRKTPTPFGPYLAFSGLICMLYGNTLYLHYLQLFRF